VDPALLSTRQEPGKAVSFAALGDTDSRHAGGQRRVARALAAVCAAAGCDFVLLLGDNFYPAGVTSARDPLFQSGFEVPYAAVAAPFLAVLGNHDYGAPGFLRDRALHQVEYTGRSRKWRMPGTYWHELHGPVELFGLDTTAEVYGEGGGQAEEVEGWIRSSGARWKIAVGHHPYRSNGPHGNAGSGGGDGGARLKAFLERVACGGVDLYLAGHDHDRQWLLPTCGGTEQIVSGASTNSYELEGDNPVRFQSAELGFFYARATEHALTGYFVGAHGKVDYRRRLTR